MDGVRETQYPYFEIIRSVDELVGDEGLWRLPPYVVEEYVLDDARKRALEHALEVVSSGENLLIMGAPGTGKTAFMLILLKNLLDRGITTGIIREGVASIGRDHEREGIILFYDDLPRIRHEALISIFRNRVKNIVATARIEEVPEIKRITGEEPWTLFRRVEIPGMSREHLREMLLRYAAREGIRIAEEEAVDIVVEKAEGLPVYIWQLVRELRIKRSPLTKTFAKEIPQGMFDYVDDILWRVLDEHPERYEILLTLLCMADMARYAIHRDLYNAIFVVAKELRTKQKYSLEEALFSDLLDNITRYLAREGATYTFRLPHDSWGDVLKGRSNGPMSGEISRINTIYPYTKRRQILLEAAKRVWNESLKTSEDRRRRDLFIRNLSENMKPEELQFIGITTVAQVETAPQPQPSTTTTTPAPPREEPQSILEVLENALDTGKITNNVINAAMTLIRYPNVGKDSLNTAAIILLKGWEKTGDDRLFTTAENILRRIGTPKAYFNLGLAYYKRGRYESAIRHYQAAANAGIIDAYYNLAAAYLRVGKINDAIATLKKYLQNKPSDQNAKSVLNALLSFLS